MKNKRKKLMKIKDTRPFAQKHPKWNTFFGFMLLIALMAGGYFLLRFLGRKLGLSQKYGAALNIFKDKQIPL